MKHNVVAARIGRSEQWLSARLNGTTNLLADDLWPIAVAIGVSPSAFFMPERAMEEAAMEEAATPVPRSFLAPAHRPGPSERALGQEVAALVAALPRADQERFGIWLQVQLEMHQAEAEPPPATEPAPPPEEPP